MTGSLQEKNGKWQLVLFGAVGVLYPNKETDTPQKKVCKWISSGLEATKKNKAAATKMLYEKVFDYEQSELQLKEKIAFTASGANVSAFVLTEKVLFTDFISDWLKRKQGQVQQSTWEKYEIYAERHIIPY
ncbi:MAG: hypothetical protein K2G32_04605, partial [Oscillospiraceae bacterium]|nr:hypothetical protein [Oscillospiraceae bacterium]